jgi:hypothetical protein
VDLNYRGKTDAKFQMDAGFICSKSFVTMAMLRNKIKIFPVIF